MSRSRSCFGDELGDETTNEFLDGGGAQLVADERVECLVGRGHAASL